MEHVPLEAIEITLRQPSTVYRSPSTVKNDSHFN